MDGITIILIIAALTGAATLGYLVGIRMRPRAASREMEAIMRSVRHRIAEGADYTDWSRSHRGDGGHIGVITFARGSVQAFLVKGVYTVQWFGRQRHPVQFDRVDTRSHAEFLAAVRRWTTPGHVHRRDPEGHAHGMLI